LYLPIGSVISLWVYGAAGQNTLCFNFTFAQLF